MLPIHSTISIPSSEKLVHKSGRTTISPRLDIKRAEKREDSISIDGLEFGIGGSIVGSVSKTSKEFFIGKCVGEFFHALF